MKLDWETLGVWIVPLIVGFGGAAMAWAFAIHAKLAVIAAELKHLGKVAAKLDQHEDKLADHEGRIIRLESQ